MPAKIESGLISRRTEYVRETTDANGDPQTPADPAWQLFSDTVRSVEWTATAGHSAQRGIGNVDPNNFFTGPEEHEFAVTYDLQQWFESGGNPQDAAADGLKRDAQGYARNTHTIVDRVEQTSIAPANTVNGATSYDTRIYTVATGSVIDECVITGDPGTQQPIGVELTYLAEKVRTYQVDQPDATTELVAVSTSANDTSQTLTIEDEGAGTTEDVSLNGTTDVSTTGTFADIDVLSLDASTEGDVQVYINDGSATSPTQGDQLAVLRGSDSYDNPGGFELGIPPLASGSHASALGSAYETFLGDTFTYAGGSLAMDINSFNIAVSNNLERTPREDDVAQRVVAGTRDIEVTATVIGETESHDSIVKTLTNDSGDIVWTMDGGTLTVTGATLTEPGSRSLEAEEAVIQLDNTFMGDGITIA